MTQLIEKKAMRPEVRFSEFKKGWSNDKLGNLFSIRSASRVHKDQWAKHGTPFFRSSDVVAKFKGIKNRKVFISNKLFDELSKKSGVIKKNDLLITGGGSIGIPYLVPDNNPLYFKDADLLWLKKSKKMHSKFLYLYLTTTVFRKYITSVTHIGTIAHYTIEQAKSTPIFFPSISEQEKIASFLTAVDEKINLLRRKHECLQTYKRGVMQKIFSQEIRFKKDDGTNFPNWEEKKANELFKNHSNKSHNSDLPILAVTQNKGIVKRVDIDKKIKTSSQSIASYKIIEPGDFVISLRSFQGGIEYSNILGISSPAYTVLKPHLEIDDAFFRIYFKKKEFINKLSSTVIGIRDGKQISYDSFSILKLPYPCLDEQRKISQFISSIEVKINLINSKVIEVETFKKGLLQKMFV